MKTNRAILMCALCIVLAACTRDDKPTEPVWGKEPCAHCAMLVGDRHFAAQAEAGGEHAYFDDVGCMVLWTESHPAGHRWVHDGTGWIAAESAHFTPGVRTPMGFGLETRKGGTLAWTEARASVLAANGGAR